MAYIQKEIKSVDDFHRMVESAGQHLPIYRGENSSSYDLKTKLGRALAHATPRLAANSLQTELAVLSHFKRHCVPYLESQPENDWDWLSLAQHHGLPTRYLDWTFNPLVALFFAIWGKVFGDSVIYILDRQKFPSSDEYASPYEIDKEVIHKPKHISNRITAQFGVFTVHDQPTDVFKDDSLVKCVIKEDALNSLRSMLYRYGTSPSSIFPGIDGIAKMVAHEFTLDIWECK